MKIDNHVHIGVAPFCYVNGWSPYALGLSDDLRERVCLRNTLA
jgi:hypothetical protein